MSDATETPAENPEATDLVSDADETSGAADQGTEPGGEETPSVEVLQKELKAARDEAAKYRVRARETREALDKAKSPEDYQAIADKAAQLEVELHTAKLATKYGLPSAIASRIQGDTEEAREEDAKSLAALFTTPDSIGSGGLTPGAKVEKTDPASLAARVPRSRR